MGFFVISRMGRKGVLIKEVDKVGRKLRECVYLEVKRRKCVKEEGLI